MRNTYQFQWFDPEDARKGLRASISRDGKLRLGQALRAMLPPRIQIGFDIKYKVLAIADGHSDGIRWAKCGVVAARRLSHQIASLGIELPISFQITPDASTGYFLGHIVPRRRRSRDGRRDFDWKQVTLIYQHLLGAATGQMAKSTPLAERRAMAAEALIAAAQQYQPGYGEIEAYLDARIRSALTQENRFYTAGYAQRSLGQPLSPSQGSSFCLSDTRAVSTDGGLSAAEDRVMAEQFWDSLSPAERRLTQMLQDGIRLSQIASHLRKTEDELTEMAHTIAQKRKDFYAVA